MLRRPAVAPLMLLGFASSFVGYSQLNAGLPAFARAVGEVSTQGLGLAFAANTLVIVLLQLVVLRRIEGRRRTRVIAVMGLLWALAWLLLGSVGAGARHRGRHGAGGRPAPRCSRSARRCCSRPSRRWSTTWPPTTCAAATTRSAPAAFQLAAVVAPPVSGLLVGHHLGGVYIGSLVVGSLLVAVVAVTRVEPQLPPGVNGVHPPAADQTGALPALRPVET